MALDLLGLVLARLEGEAVEAGKEEAIPSPATDAGGDDRSESYAEVGLALGLRKERSRRRLIVFDLVTATCFVRKSAGRSPIRGSRRRAGRPDQLAGRFIGSGDVSPVDDRLVARDWRNRKA